MTAIMRLIIGLQNNAFRLPPYRRVSPRKDLHFVWIHFLNVEGRSLANETYRRRIAKLNMDHLLKTSPCHSKLLHKLQPLLIPKKLILKLFLTCSPFNPHRVLRQLIQTETTITSPRVLLNLTPQLHHTLLQAHHLILIFFILLIMLLMKHSELVLWLLPFDNMDKNWADLWNLFKQTTLCWGERLKNWGVSILRERKDSLLYDYLEREVHCFYRGDI